MTTQGPTKWYTFGSFSVGRSTRPNSSLRRPVLLTISLSLFSALYSSLSWLYITRSPGCATFRARAAWPESRRRIWHGHFHPCRLTASMSSEYRESLYSSQKSGGNSCWSVIEKRPPSIEPRRRLPIWWSPVQRFSSSSTPSPAAIRTSSSSMISLTRLTGLDLCQLVRMILFSLSFSGSCKSGRYQGRSGSHKRSGSENFLSWSQLGTHDGKSGSWSWRLPKTSRCSRISLSCPCLEPP